MAERRSPQTWNAELYTRTAGFVADLAEPVLDLLAPAAGQRILDLGCGDGKLTHRIVSVGAEVVAVDASPAMVAAARAQGIDARLMSAEELLFKAEFDAVFSNATLHWVLEPSKAIDGIRSALRPGGRFVAEFGGAGNIHHICEALSEALRERGQDYRAISPWYFPSPEEYAALLQEAGFTVETIGLHERPTQLPGDLSDWLAVFAAGILGIFPAAERAAVVGRIRSILLPKLSDGNGIWTVDYVRLRLAARRGP